MFCELSPDSTAPKTWEDDLYYDEIEIHIPNPAHENEFFSFRVKSYIKWNRIKQSYADLTGADPHTIHLFFEGEQVDAHDESSVLETLVLRDMDDDVMFIEVGHESDTRS
ncbi:uncharacterized protein EHS24_004180 [Apiotrichum porosum]|uniref:Ubiquitin-like domain-containing protein n=1 Tax=Apiotrichum porosum TaxID=105984 RepID=A0A427Y4J2_9TREE|nr:uncharacterized protein EHS24_004180 [Apiotrichum porosum]RSH85993.1 hypothetical protein EHS24_004180 [Apiotrichum porosum]